MDLNKLPNIAFLNNIKKIDTFKNEDYPLLEYNDQQWKKLFIKPPKGDYKQLQMTYVGTYSIAKPEMGDALIQFIKHQISFYGDIPNPISTETNGGVGGFTLSLLQNFKTVNVVEINTTHANIIKNNMNVYGFKKVNVLNKDYLDICLNLKQDIIISDPPWGGKSFIHQKSIRLGFSNIDIVFIINELYKQNKFKLFIFLAPFNYDFNYFFKNIISKYVHIEKIKRHYFVCIFKLP